MHVVGMMLDGENLVCGSFARDGPWALGYPRFSNPDELEYSSRSCMLHPRRHLRSSPMAHLDWYLRLEPHPLQRRIRMDLHCQHSSQQQPRDQRYSSLHSHSRAVVVAQNSGQAHSLPLNLEGHQRHCLSGASTSCLYCLVEQSKSHCSPIGCDKHPRTHTPTHSFCWSAKTSLYDRGAYWVSQIVGQGVGLMAKWAADVRQARASQSSPRNAAKFSCGCWRSLGVRLHLRKRAFAVCYPPLG